MTEELSDAKRWFSLLLATRFILDLLFYLPVKHSITLTGCGDIMF